MSLKIRQFQHCLIYVKKSWKDKGQIAGPCEYYKWLYIYKRHLYAKHHQAYYASLISFNFHVHIFGSLDPELTLI